MKKDIKKDDVEWKIFMDIWSVYKEYAIPEADDKYWQDLIKDMGAITQKYDNPLASRLVMGVCKALDDMGRKNDTI